MQINTLRAQLRILEAGLERVKDDYRQAVFNEHAITREIANMMIEKARLTPQKNPRLQRIHEYYQLVERTRKKKIDAEKR